MLLDERPVATLERGKVGRIDALSEAFKARWQKPDQNPFLSPYELAVADEVDGAQLKSAFQTAAFSGWGEARLDLGGRSVALHALLPRRPEEKTFNLIWPEEPLVIVVRRDSVELWRAKTTARTAPANESSKEATPGEPVTPPPDEPAKSVGSVAAENVSKDLPFLLRTVCEQGSACDPSMLYVADDAPFSLVRSALQALATIPTENTNHSLQLRLGQPEAPGTPLRVRIGATAVSGRLPPKVIQDIVRANYGHLRVCYEAGLGRDPNLTGKVITRFVIGRDGRVPNVSVGEGTTMPDLQVTECVVAAFRNLQFPQPEGGIVTVVYPIVFAPGE